jgi:tRNA G37 N-methylase TrmD
MRIEVVTLFPEMIQDALRHGVTGRAIRRELI